MSQSFRDLGPTARQTVFALVLGVAGGLLLYVASVHLFQQALLNAILRAKPLVVIANTDARTTAGRSPLDPESGSQADVSLAYAPRLIDLLLSTTGRTDFSGQETDHLRAVANDLRKGESACLRSLSTPGIDLITCMAVVLAQADSDGKKTLIDGHRHLLAASVAGFSMPGLNHSTASLYLSAAAVPDSAGKKAAVDRLSQVWGDGLVPLALSWRFKSDSAAAAGQLVKTLNCFGVLRPCMNPGSADAGASQPALNDKQLTIVDLQVALVGLVRSDSDVRFFQSALSAAIGYEQAVLWILFVWMLVLSGLRQIAIAGAKRSRATLSEQHWGPVRCKETGVGISAQGLEWIAERWYDSRWQFRWGSKALPAVGFLGTVRGILLALPQAESIVRAATPLEQSAAISSVAGSLGLAFSTTLLALLFGLATTLLDDYQQRKENSLLAEVEVS